MLAFVSHTPYVSTSLTRQSRLSLHRKPKATTSTSFSFFRTTTSCVVRSDSVKEKGEGDEGIYGEAYGKINGLKVPELSEEDQQYLDGAGSGKEFMQRMTAIAKRMDQDRLMNNARTGVQSSDDYIDSLDKVKMFRSDPEQYQQEQEQKQKQQQQQQQQQEQEKKQQQQHVVIPAEDIVESIKAEQEEYKDIESIEEEIARINQELIDAMESEKKLSNDSINETESNEATDIPSEQIEQSVKQVEELQKQLQIEIGTELSPDVSGMNVSNEDSSVIDRQIAYLESHLEKIKNDAIKEGDDKLFKEQQKAEEGDDKKTMDKVREEGMSLLNKAKQKISQNPSDSSGDSLKFDGLENTPGAMDPDEKRAAFEALRKQAMANKNESNPYSDPFNVTLPEKNQGPPGYDRDESGSVTASSIKNRAFAAAAAASENINSLDSNDLYANVDGAVPRGDESEYDSFATEGSSMNKQLLIEEIEMEMKTYTEQSRDLLKHHDARMGVLLARLMTLEG